jgi:hypothetical protein
MNIRRMTLTTTIKATLTSITTTSTTKIINTITRKHVATIHKSIKTIQTTSMMGICTIKPMVIPMNVTPLSKELG